MDHENVTIEASLMKYRFYQKRPSCFLRRCLRLDSHSINERARVIKRLLPLKLCE